MDPRYILVSGSREIRQMSLVQLVLAPFWSPDTILIHGDCARGFDRMCCYLWKRWGGVDDPFPADWRPNGVYRPAAGFDRNARMVTAAAARPTLRGLVALRLDNSKGTGHAVRCALSAGIPTIVYHARTGVPGLRIEGPYPDRRLV